MPAGLVRPNRRPQASKRDQNPSSYTSGSQSAGIWLAASAASRAAARPSCEHAAGQPYRDPCNVAEPGRVRGIRTADQVIGDRERHRSVLRLHEAHSAYFVGEIHRGGRVLTDSPSAPVLADVLVIADEDHRADPGVPHPGQVDDLLPRGRAAVR